MNHWEHGGHRESFCRFAFTYMDVGKGREQGAVASGERGAGKGTSVSYHT